eukprot:9476464-Pyramimonas_sp.AAC.1
MSIFKIASFMCSAARFHRPANVSITLHCHRRKFAPAAAAEAQRGALWNAAVCLTSALPWSSALSR